MTVLYILVGYVLAVNLLGFALMGIDKRRAIKDKWRISEMTLFVVAIIGGSLGSTLGMRFFHHKTRHWYFVYGMPLILLIHILLIIILIISPIQVQIL